MPVGQRSALPAWSGAAVRQANEASLLMLAPVEPRRIGWFT